jgi:uncharacterized repeat protein (TIGR01451 family)/LPXTG-motif cell wall-anchored protein
VNTATVSSTTADPVTSNNTATVSSPVDYADLSVSKQAVTAVVRGQDVTYRIAVSNAGPSTAPAGIVVTDPLPPVLAFVSAAGDGWTCTNDNGTVRCTASAPIPVGSTSTFTLVARVATNATGSVANTAVLSGTVTPGDTLPPTGGITDPSAANNTVVANNTIAASLPGTGSASYRMATLAGLLVAFGAIALVGTRRRRLA